jgi:hypothetical protein
MLLAGIALVALSVVAFWRVPARIRECVLASSDYWSSSGAAERSASVRFNTAAWMAAIRCVIAVPSVFSGSVMISVASGPAALVWFAPKVWLLQRLVEMVK